jgi:hypothetical protein
MFHNVRWTNGHAAWRRSHETSERKRIAQSLGAPDKRFSNSVRQNAGSRRHPVNHLIWAQPRASRWDRHGAQITKALGDRVACQSMASADWARDFQYINDW